MFGPEDGDILTNDKPHSEFLYKIGRLFSSDIIKPPDWRWRLVLYIRVYGNGLESIPLIKKCFRKDLFLKRLLKFSRIVDLVSTEEIFSNVLPKTIKKNQDIFEAWQIYENPELSSIKTELEARILADEDPKEIIRKLDLQESVYTAYCSGFFDVADKLKNPSVIIWKVIFKDSPDADLTLFENKLKFLGYFCGPRMVDFLVYRFNLNDLPTDDTLNKKIAEDIKKNLQIKLWLLSKNNTLENDKLIKLLEAVYKTETILGSNEGSIIQQIFGSIDWKIEKRGEVDRDAIIGNTQLSAEKNVLLSLDELSENRR